MKPKPPDSLGNVIVGIKDKIAITAKKFVPLAIAAFGLATLSACTPEQDVAALGFMCIGGTVLGIGIAVAHVLD